VSDDDPVACVGHLGADGLPQTSHATGDKYISLGHVNPVFNLLRLNWNLFLLGKAGYTLTTHSRHVEKIQEKTR
jgi:hypothetical protein